MKKPERYRYEMLVRVRDFGTANRDVFPESSTGGQAFAQVAAAVSAVEDALTKRDLARVEARRVKAATRASVYEYMKTLALTARHAMKDEPFLNPFVMPSQKTTEALLSKARAFVGEARSRETAFVTLGLPPGFISEFSALVDHLHTAVEVKNSGRALRTKAQGGVEHALDLGAEAVKTLDVLVPNVLRSDPVRLAHWRGARRLEGVHSSSATTHLPSPAVEPAAPPESPVPQTVPVPTVGEALQRAS
jgi:hypothetical protein